jgi:Uri superfamily endonuclease
MTGAQTEWLSPAEHVNKAAAARHDGLLASLTEVRRTAPGTYVLVMRLETPGRVVVGARGAFELAAGYYLYVGGALNGLLGRLRRHVRTDAKKLYWHVDYLRAATRVVDIWWTLADERLECGWATTLGSLPNVSEAISRFGSGDCRCATHLFYTAGDPPFEAFSHGRSGRVIRRARVDSEPVPRVGDGG